MKTTIVRGRQVICRITGRNSAEVIEDGAVAIQDGVIADVGRYDELPARYRADEVIGSSDHIVTPGLINAHHHVGLTPLSAGIARYALGNMDNRSLGVERG